MATPLVLMILDGWGYRVEKAGNAIALARTPNWDKFWNSYPHTLLKCAGTDVGLPEGTMGNSEVGHLNIGSGRIIYQDFTRITNAIRDKSFFKNKALIECFKKTAAAGGTVHLMGLVSDVGVHAHIEHLFALIEMAKENGLKNIYIHCFTDGRDSPPTSGINYIKEVERKIGELKAGCIATVSGRWWAMDRDKRWERIEKVYDAIVDGKGSQAKSALDVLSASYAKGVTDEFIEPAVIVKDGRPVAKLNDNDAVVFFNFRSDRMRELTSALALGSATLKKFDGFKRKKALELASVVCMTEYDETFGLPVAFPSAVPKNVLGEVISAKGLKQLRIAETEKYAHVTFFFDGGEEKIFKGEERCLIPSPRDVPTYDKKPEMSAYIVTNEVIRRIEDNLYDVIILNFANGDMVGHTGVLPAAIKAVEALDECIGKITDAILQKKGSLLMTSDHGNCENMLDKNGSPLTAHTTNVVPFLYISNDTAAVRLKAQGRLSDIAPTMLELLKIDKPKEMTGETLFVV